MGHQDLAAVPCRGAEVRGKIGGAQDIHSLTCRGLYTSHFIWNCLKVLQIPPMTLKAYKGDVFGILLLGGQGFGGRLPLAGIGRSEGRFHVAVGEGEL